MLAHEVCCNICSNCSHTVMYGLAICVSVWMKILYQFIGNLCGCFTIFESWNLILFVSGLHCNL